MEWKISRGHGKCINCESELKENQVFFSALIDNGIDFLRQDFCSKCWEANNKTQVFSYWKTRVPEKVGDRRPEVDDEVLLDFFTRLEPEKEAAKVQFRFLLGLILMRKKRLKFEDVEKEEGREYLVLRQTREKIRHRVFDPKLSQEELDSLKDKLHQMLYLEA